MSMDHKAYVFDYSAFERDLAPILGAALASSDLVGLTKFIETNRPVLSDPCEGKPLSSDWRQALEYVDVHQLGDLALTKYYRPDQNLGVSTDWMEIDDALADAGLSSEVFLGKPFGPPATPFDPGKMGSYFHSESAARSSLAQLEKLPLAKAQS